MVVRVVMLMIRLLAHSQHCIGERLKRAIQPRGAVMVVVRVVMLIIRFLDLSRVEGAAHITIQARDSAGLS